MRGAKSVSLTVLRLPTDQLRNRGEPLAPVRKRLGLRQYPNNNRHLHYPPRREPRTSDCRQLAGE